MLNQPRVMARGHGLRPDGVGIVEQLAELQPGIAEDARVGCSPGGVLGDEAIDEPVEIRLEVQHVEGDVEHVGHTLGVRRVGGRATGSPLSPWERGRG